MRASNPRRVGRLALLAVALLGLGGCAGFSKDGGFSSVERTAGERLDKEVVWARSDSEREQLKQRVGDLLTKPLSVDDAVQVALFNNPGLQASFHELGISEADLVQAGRLPNPGFSFGRLTKGDEVELERGVHLNVARLIAMPMTRRLEARRFEQVQRETSLRVLELAAETRKAYYQAVAAEESLRYMGKVKEAADASAELARRMAEAGNFSKLQRAREQSFYADASLNLVRAEQARTAARERLIRLLGLWGEQTAFQLPERLPDLPENVDELPDIERTAMASRLDIEAAKLGAESLAKNLGLSRTTRFVNVLELGAVHNSSNEEPTQRGYEISVELPLFDWSGARVAKAESLYRQALERTAETAINARSEVREAYFGYRSAYDIARHYRDEILPLRQRIAEENVLRYNGMLIGVFELLADARTQMASVNGYIDALRDFWIARADLDMALVGKPSLSASSGVEMAAEAPAGH